jgi:hypothetical protein
LSTRSKTAFWDGRLSDAAELARAGHRWAGSTSVAVLLAAQEADAAASTGWRRDARTALASAADHRDRVTRPDTVGGLLSCGPGRLSNYAAGVYLRIDQPDDALREADAALASFQAGDQRAYGTEMQIHITRALGHLHRGAVDGAADALGPVLTAPADHRLATVAGRLGDVLTALDEPTFAGSRATGTIQQAITAFRAESAALTLPPAIEEDPG